MNGSGKTRAAEVRSATERPKNWVPPNSNPLANATLGPEWALKLVRKYINGAEEDRQAFFKRTQRGWIPVKAEELPDFEYLQGPTGYIEAMGCILCKKLKSETAHDVQYYEDYSRGMLAGVTQAYEKEDANNEYVKKFVEGGRTEVFRGRLPNK